MSWQPNHIIHADETFRTATDTTLVTTDAGKGYLKALGNKGSPHYLAADLVAIQLARWLGLPTFEFAVMNVTDIDEITFKSGREATPGPAFITRAMQGFTWGSSAGGLENLVNPEDIGRLVVFDTWTRNFDRYPPDITTRKPNLGNVFFSTEGLPAGQSRLIAMDHTHCFNGGRDLNGGLAHIGQVKDPRIFGLFPEFIPYLKDPALRPAWEAAVSRLGTLDSNEVRAIVSRIPREWEVDAVGRNALAEQICQRASFICSDFVALITPRLN